MIRALRDFFRKFGLPLLSTSALFGLGLLILYVGTARVVVYHTNDTHGWIMPHEPPPQFPEPEPKTRREKIVRYVRSFKWFKRKPEGPEGGAAVLSAYLKKSPKGYLLIDSGDFFRGTPEVDLSSGTAAIECMNLLGYHAAALGNHEYDLGEANVAQMAKLAKFPFLSANLYRAETTDRVPYALPYVIKTVENARVGIVGLITSKMPLLTLPRHVRGLYFQRELDALRNTVRILRDQGVHVVIVAAHVGFEPPDAPPGMEGEKFLAANVPGVALILGGHTHAGLKRAYQHPKTKTVIVHNDSEWRTVTKTVLRVWKRSGTVLWHSHQLVRLRADKYGEDADVKALVERYRWEIGQKLDYAVGNSTVAITRAGYETAIGNWQTDVLRWYAKADIAFQNIGGIRSDLPEGLITHRRLYQMSPFDNTIVTMLLSGAQVRDILEYSASGAPGYIQFSGLKTVHDKSRPFGRRLVDARLKSGAPLVSTASYRVALNDFLASGGDGFSTFKNGRGVTQTNVTLRQLWTEFVKRYSPISAAIDGRMIVKDGSETPELKLEVKESTAAATGARKGKK